MTPLVIQTGKSYRRLEEEKLNPKHVLPVREVDYNDPTNARYAQAALRGGIEHKHVVIDSNDDVWMMKSQNGQAEIDAMTIASAIGLRTPKVRQYVGPWSCFSCLDNTRNFGGTLVLIEWLDDTNTGDAYATNLRPDDAVRVAALDHIIGMWDRKGANWLWDSDGRIIPIDHGFTMEWSRSPVSWMSLTDRDVAEKTTREERAAIYADIRVQVAAVMNVLHPYHTPHLAEKLLNMVDVVENLIDIRRAA